MSGIAPYFRIPALPVLASLLLASGIASAQNKDNNWLTTNFQARTHTSAQVTGMTYRLYKPVNYNPAVKYPIVVALHGIGERGNNNTAQIQNEELPQPWIRDSVQAKHPHFVMVPQCPSTNNQFWWPSNVTNNGAITGATLGVVQILDSLKREFSLDTTRFYIAGLSMGGYGTWDLIRRYPKMFAAAVPTAGLGFVPASDTIAQTPVWAFHGATDPTVVVSGSRNIMRKLDTTGYKVVYFTSDTGMTNPAAYDSLHPVVSIDSLRKAVYVTKARYLYSEVRNVPGSGNTLHAAGWLAAWRHPMLTDWVFSKQKVNGVTGLVNPALAGAMRSNPRARLVLGANGRVLLERTATDGRALRYNLEGKRLDAAGAAR